MANYKKSNKENISCKNSLERMKEEVASEIGVDLKSENLTAKDAGRVGGQMTKKLVEKAEENM